MMTEQNQGMKINMVRAGELASEMCRRQTITARFRFNMPPQTALDLLAAAYKQEVESRHRQFILDENTGTNLIKLAGYLTNDVPKFGIMCCGTCGNGKTTLLRAFQRVLNFLDGKRHFGFLNTEYSTFHAGMTIYHAKEIAEIAKKEEDFQELKTRDMLAIDDLGTEPAEVLSYGNVLSPVTDLIEHRYNNQLFTFITTNLTSKSENPKIVTIRKKYGDRIADRFNEMLHVIVFKDITYRK